MSAKTPIRRNDEVIKFLKSARTRIDQIRLFLMVAFGLHPKNVKELKEANIVIKGDVYALTFKRAKNDAPRTELLSEYQAKAILAVIRAGKLKRDRKRYEQICLETQERAGLKYHKEPIRPMTLRHTYILNVMKNFWTGATPDFHLIAIKAGCKPETVRKNYVELDDWERLHKDKERTPLDLSGFMFME